MKIQFHTVKYDLENDVTVFDDRLHAVFYKGENLFDNIVNDTLEVEDVKIYNDTDDLVSVYSGFKSRISLYVSEDNILVSVELERLSLVDARLNDLEDTVDILAETILGE